QLQAYLRLPITVGIFTTHAKIPRLFDGIEVSKVLRLLRRRWRYRRLREAADQCAVGVEPYGTAGQGGGGGKSRKRYRVRVRGTARSARRCDEHRRRHRTENLASSLLHRVEAPVLRASRQARAVRRHRSRQGGRVEILEVALTELTRGRSRIDCH